MKKINIFMVLMAFSLQAMFKDTVNIKDQQGKAALHLIFNDLNASNYSEKIKKARVLLFQGAVLTEKDASGKTPMDYATEQKDAFPELYTVFCAFKHKQSRL